MNIAIWIIAICELVRTVQITVSMIASAKTQSMMEKAYGNLATAEEELSEEKDKMRDEIMSVFFKKTHDSQDTYTAGHNEDIG